jgi:aerobic carbon-monoxide dehydrogenase large subunit
MSTENIAAPSMASRFGSGQTVRRIEDPALVQGRGQFTDDVVLPGQLHLCFLRSSVAHARIATLDVQSARTMPGVVAIYTGAELVAAGVKPIPLAPAFQRPDGKPMTAAPKRALAHEFVRYVGEPLVAVVADSREAARAAADAIQVEYDDLPAVSSTQHALAAGAPAVWAAAPDNICAQARHGDVAKVAAAFAAAAHHVVLDIDNQRLAPSPMEPRTVLAWVDAESQRLYVRLSSQMPGGLRNSLADALPGQSVKSIRVLVGDVGGGFGMKTGIYVEDIAVAYAALQLKRPVKWRPDRVEEFLSAVHGRDQQSHAELALHADGRVLALRVSTLANVGAYPSTTSVVIPLMIGPWVITSIYDIPVIDLKLTAVMTNINATGAYRGAGRPECIYLIERLMDAAARQLGIAPEELRRRNMVRPDQMPYKNAMAQVYDCGEFEKIMDRGLAVADWAGFEARRAQSKASGKLRGRGLATFLEWTGAGAFEERVTVDVLPDGIIEIFTATQAMGQGIATSYAQLAVDVFGVPIERIRICQGDTDRGVGFGSAASRSLFTGGAALRVAAHETLAKARELAAQELEAPAADLLYEAGRYVVAGTDVGIDLAQLAARQQDARIAIVSTSAVAGPSWPNGCHVCEVEIDPDTGDVQLVAYASVNDIGTVVSPGIVRGQVDGGAVQGIGQALSERVVYDDSGQLLSASFMDYAMPRADGFVGFKTEFDTSVPCLNNTLGVKGVGELGTIGATPAVVNAVLDALAAAGVGDAVYQLQMPLTSERVWRVLHGR